MKLTQSGISIAKETFHFTLHEISLHVTDADVIDTHARTHTHTVHRQRICRSTIRQATIGLQVRTVVLTTHNVDEERRYHPANSTGT